MRRTAPARTAKHRTLGAAAVALLIVVAAIVGAIGGQPASGPAPSPSLRAARPPGDLVAVPPVPPSPPALLDDEPRGPRGGAIPRDGRAVSREDGALPGGVTVTDDEYPGIANLEPDLLRAMRDATAAAARVGIEIHVNSGWRSAAYQDRLRREAVAKYGSEEDAARWVATADTSAHVSGDAVDVGPADASAWLSDRGAEFGLCQVYRNEPWHFELRPDATAGGCPRMYADSAHDPRVRH